MDQMNPTGNPMDPNMAPVPDMGVPVAPAPEIPMAPAPTAPGESDGGMIPPVAPMQ